MRTFDEVQDEWFDLLRNFGTEAQNDPYDQGYGVGFLDALEWVMGEGE